MPTGVRARVETPESAGAYSASKDSKTAHGGASGRSVRAIVELAERDCSEAPKWRAESSVQCESRPDET
jgi:hypothetical protein